MKDSSILGPNKASLAMSCFSAIVAVASIPLAPALQAVLILVILGLAIAAALPIRL
jgi:hypothetical protein